MQYQSARRLSAKLRGVDRTGVVILDPHIQPAPLSARMPARILGHIRSSGMAEGDHLPEQALADAFKVSRAPVRAALKSLEKLGVVRAEPNRGFFLAADPDELDRLGEDVSPDADDEPYLAVAADRLSGALPERVSENELMRRYSLPRGQIVKILSRIAQEGWIERLPGHGWLFLPVLSSGEAYDQGYRFRIAVEAAALLEPTFKVDAADLSAVRHEQEELLGGGVRTFSRTQLFRINSGFHETLMEWSGNPFFVDALRRLNRMRRLIEYRVTVDRSRLDQQCREHLEILSRLQEGDQVSASRYLAEHINGARRIRSTAFG